MAAKKNAKPNMLTYVEAVIILLLAFLYLTKPTQTVSVGSLTSTTTIAPTTTIPTAYVRALYSNQTITVPAYTNNTVFYNSTYGTYNNYTLGGNYNITFDAPYDGYLIVYIQQTSAPIFTYGFTYNSNASGVAFCPAGCNVYNLTSGAAIKGISGFAVTPALNSTFYHFIPVLRGNETFSFQNFNPYPITLTFSLTYVGDEYPNATPLTLNYSEERGSPSSI